MVSKAQNPTKSYKTQLDMYEFIQPLCLSHSQSFTKLTNLSLQQLKYTVHSFCLFRVDGSINRCRVRPFQTVRRVGRKRLYAKCLDAKVGPFLE